MLLTKDWEQYFPKKQADGQYHPVTYAAGPLLHMKRTIILQNLNS